MVGMKKKKKTKKSTRIRSSGSSLSEELRKHLKIDRLNLDEELIKQPQLFFEVAEAAAIARSRMDAAKDNVERVESDVDQRIRQDAANEDERLTEKEIKALIQNDDDRVKAYASYLDLKRQTEELDQLRDSFRQRGYMLRELAALYISGYFQTSSTKGRGHKAREVRAEAANEKLMERKRTRS